MTRLSVNLNKIALLRNSRGRDYPNVVEFAKRFIDLGVQGITVHPRQDERHIKRQDAYDLAAFLKDFPDVEYNVEGYPSDDFIQLIEDTKPDQCTLVPDSDTQLTSDHGWQVMANRSLLDDVLVALKRANVRSALFLDPDPRLVDDTVDAGYDRIELHTEAYANAHSKGEGETAIIPYQDACNRAVQLNIGVNAGHDLDLSNLGDFLAIGNVLEVSIGHALTVECILNGIEPVTKQYLQICHR
ncbi:MAG: pyridoxine 5'-phosphate synthase [Pseudomonadota bacterium]